MIQRHETKGPWKLYLGNAGERDGIGYIRPEPEDGMEIAHHGDMGRSKEENLANGLLIAGAPVMRDALDLFIRQWNACGPNSDLGRYFGNVRNTAVAALKFDSSLEPALRENQKDGASPHSGDDSLTIAARKALEWLEKNSPPWTAVPEISALRHALKVLA